MYHLYVKDIMLYWIRHPSQIVDAVYTHIKGYLKLLYILVLATLIMYMIATKKY